MNRLIAVVVLLGFAFWCGAQTSGHKTWVETEDCTPGQNGTADACFYFLEDKETHTRCYAARAVYHEGMAISCVKQ